MGQEPGSPVFIGKRWVEIPGIQVFTYNQEVCTQYEPDSAAALQACVNPEMVTWVNVVGVHDVELVQECAEVFGIHPLLVEDIVNTGQRARFEEVEDRLFATLKMLQYDEPSKRVISEQISLVVGDRFVISFQEHVEDGDVFQPIRDRLVKNKGRIRNEGALYLAYALVDAIVDNYILLVERIGERIEDLELRVMKDESPKLLDELYTFKREMNYLSKVIRPAKELVYNLIKAETSLIPRRFVPFLKDLFDNVTHAVESIDTYRDLLSDFLNIYHTRLNFRLNDIIRVLTIFSALFIPLTFIVGVYGMNFDVMPELKWKYGYFVLWGVMLTVSGLMVWYFRKNRWI